MYHRRRCFQFSTSLSRLSSNPSSFGLSVLSLKPQLPRFQHGQNVHTASKEQNEFIQSMKYPTRGGRNLSERYRRLERSLRRKEAYEVQREGYEPSGSQAGVNLEQNAMKGPTLRKKGPVMFKGFVVPEKPEAPGSEDCCMSGCAVCVLDLYEENLEAYNATVASLCASLTALKIPESEWPSQIKTQPDPANAPPKTAGISLSAFEELERALKAKHAAEASAQSMLSS